MKEFRVIVTGRIEFNEEYTVEAKTKKSAEKKAIEYFIKYNNKVDLKSVTSEAEEYE